MIFFMMIIKNLCHVGWQLLCVWVDASRGSLSQGGWNIICQGAGGGAGDDGDSGDGDSELVVDTSSSLIEWKVFIQFKIDLFQTGNSKFNWTQTFVM